MTGNPYLGDLWEYTKVSRHPLANNKSRNNSTPISLTSHSSPICHNARQDGQVLCALANVLQPGIIKKVRLQRR